MSEVSVLGLGQMGSALARALLASGRSVTVWNRTPSRAEPLAGAGGAVASSAAAAVEASPVFVVCVSDYEATARIVEAADVAPALRGRIMVQLSTGTPQEARDGEARARRLGAEYLDGAILAYPRQIGTPEATILVAGGEGVFARTEALLRILAPNTAHVGPQVGAASALDCATLSFMMAAIVGLAHGALLVESEGLAVDEFGAMMADVAPILGQEAKHLGAVIASSRYAGPEASLATYAGAGERLVRNAREAALSAELPEFLSGLFRRALDAGYGEEEVAALVKVLRSGGSRPAAGRP